METLIKKRGRKPKNNISTTINDDIVKKKRGRKKKYEIENSEKIINRNEIDNFNHRIAYSDDEKHIGDIENIKNISFGNLNITVSKKNNVENNNYRNSLIIKTKTNNLKINENEYSSDEEEIVKQDNYSSKNIETSNENNMHSNQYGMNNNNQNIKFDFKNKIKTINSIKTLKHIIINNTFPDKTNIYCWWCCHPFECPPCTLPIDYSSYTRKYKCVGIFCSWNCVKSYNFDLKDQKVSERATIITLILKQLFSLEFSLTIKSAPPRQTLKIFGGYLTIDDFRNNNNEVENYKLNLLGTNFIYPEIIEIKNVNRKNKLFFKK